MLIVKFAVQISLMQRKIKFWLYRWVDRGLYVCP